MTAPQIILSLVLALLVFSLALDLGLEDFRRVAQAPRGVAGGLLVQFVLLPGFTWLATMLLDLPPQVEVAMILIAVCPGGTTSSFITHLGRGNAALSVSISAAGALAAPLLTPLNFSWMVGANPVTASWLRALSIDPKVIFFTLLVLLAAPLVLGMAFRQRWPGATARLRKPLARLALGALVAFIAVNVVLQRELLTLAVLPLLALAVAHNASGLLLGHLCARALGIGEADRRAVVIEGGMQNAGLALGIIAVQFNSDTQMVVFVSLWGLWHSVTGLGLAFAWRRATPAGDRGLRPAEQLVAPAAPRRD